jgi:hypothetical protein
MVIIMIAIKVCVILLFILTVSCGQDFEALKEVDRIETYDFERFKNVHIKARIKKDGKNIAHFYEEKINGQCYRVPNLEYYPYSTLGENQQKMLESYRMALQADERYKVSLKKESQKVFELFSEINFYQIYGDPQHCQCIRFDFDEDTHLYYFENVSKVQSDLTRQKLKSAKEINKNWYLVQDASAGRESSPK